MRRWIVGMVGLATLLVAGAFAYLNADPVRVDYYFGALEFPLAGIVAGVFAAGALLSAVVLLPVAVVRKRRLLRLHKRLQQAEQELSNLRREPMRGAD